MKRDPDKVVDASADRSTDWDAGIASGDLVQVTPMTRDTSSPDHQHVQGVPLTAAEAQARVVPLQQMREAMQEAEASGGRAYRPQRASGKGFFGAPPGGWPQFGKKEDRRS